MADPERHKTEYTWFYGPKQMSIEEWNRHEELAPRRLLPRMVTIDDFITEVGLLLKHRAFAYRREALDIGRYPRPINHSWPNELPAPLPGRDLPGGSYAIGRCRNQHTTRDSIAWVSSDVVRVSGPAL